jgi:radical SAM enzyme (TIGR01210 family)
MIDINKTPLYQGLYHGPEGKELTVSLRTAPCRFNCTMCAWKSDYLEKIEESDVVAQIEGVISNYRHRIPEVEQFSFGNEGSVLDEKTLKLETLLQITEILRDIFPRISFETQVAFITQDRIEALKKAASDKPIEFTVGFETSNNDIRQKVLRKGLPQNLFERKIALLSKNNIFIRVYVMLKPSPYMSEAEGIEDCVSTIKYLHDLGEKNNNPIVVHLNPTFILKGSKFEAMAKAQHYKPPTLWSLAEVLHRVKPLGMKFHLGLSIEGIEHRNGYIFGNCETCNPVFLKEMRQYNKHHDLDRLIEGLPSCTCRPPFITF